MVMAGGFEGVVKSLDWDHSSINSRMEKLSFFQTLGPA